MYSTGVTDLVRKVLKELSPLNIYTIYSIKYVYSVCVKVNMYIVYVLR